MRVLRERDNSSGKRADMSTKRRRHLSSLVEINQLIRDARPFSCCRRRIEKERERGIMMKRRRKCCGMNHRRFHHGDASGHRQAARGARKAAREAQPLGFRRFVIHHHQSDARRPRKNFLLARPLLSHNKSRHFLDNFPVTRTEFPRNYLWWIWLSFEFEFDLECWTKPVVQGSRDSLIIGFGVVEMSTVRSFNFQFNSI